MTFLTPIPALIALGLGLPTLLTFYLLKLRRKPVTVSSIMLWEEVTRDLQVNVPLRWLKFTLLLLAHLLVLLLLAGALGRPVIEAGPDSAARVYLLIDTSASMSAVDTAAGGTRFDEARRRAARAAREAADTSDAELTVIAFAHTARVAGPPTHSPSLAAAQLDALSPTDQPGNPAAALALVDALETSARAAAGETAIAGTARAILFSDGANPAQAEPLRLAGTELIYRVVGPVPTPVPTTNTPADATPNAGIVAAAAVLDDTDPTLVRVFTRLHNHRAEPVATFLRLTLDGADATTPTPSTAVRIPAATPDTPGELTQSITTHVPAGGVLTLMLDHPDALATDNTASFALAPPRRPALLVIAPPGATGAAAPDPFLMDVLDALEPRRLLAVPPDTYAAAVRAGDVDAFDVLVFDRISPAALPPKPSIHLGAAPPLPGFDPTAEPIPSRQRALTWSRTHPLMRGLSLDALVVAAAVPLPDEAGATSIDILALGERGPLIIETTDNGRRRLIVAFPLAQSNWPLDVSFPIFLAASIERLTGTGPAAVAFTTIDPIPNPIAESPRVRLTGPIERTIEPGSAIGVLPLAGVYTATAADGRAAPIAVNLVNVAETDCRPRPTLEVSGETVHGIAAGAARSRRELWPLFVLIATALLTAEWFIYALRMRA